MKRLALGAGLVATGELVLYLLWSRIDDNDAFPSLEIQLAVVAGISIFLIPHVLAVLARKDRPSLYLAAGLLGILLTLASALSIIVLAVIPFVFVPSCIYLLHYRRRPMPVLPAPLITLAIVVLGIGSVWALFQSSSDQRCYEVRQLRDGTLDYDSATEADAMYASRSEIGGGCSSDVFAYYETLTSLGLQLLMYRVGWLAARPRPGSAGFVTPTRVPGETEPTLGHLWS